MAEPDWNPDTGGRSLAEILREAGIESANRAARRRSWDDPEETGIRQRRAEASAADGVAGRTGYRRRRSDQTDEPPPAAERRQQPDRQQPDRQQPDRQQPDRQQSDRQQSDRRQARPAAPGPSTAAIPGLRPDRKPGVPAAAPMPSAPVPVRERRAADLLPQRSVGRPATGADHPSTGPIPVVRPDQIAEDLDATPKESALAWLRFAGELVIALAAGVGCTSPPPCCGRWCRTSPSCWRRWR
jgi:hypothetical protein